jgi:nicotinate-nucleotide pyrophosphorylase (carboxylating)
VVEAGTAIGRLGGSGRDLLTAERILLNLVGRLSGIATLTASYVRAVAGTKAQIYDTRKTTPGWRRLEKYAVRCGGGTNHRQGLYDAILIKDNHLALAAEQPQGLSPAQAVVRCREFLQTAVPDLAGSTIVEVEVDTLEQLREVLAVAPDVVLLDNMNLDQLREAVRYRDQQSPAIQLEASGGIDLQRVASVAATGVDRISVGALTHAAASLDIGLDWQSGGDACEGKVLGLGLEEGC